MADFQSSKTAAEIEEVLTGALTYKSSQTLTETEKAFVREKIGATELGEGIKIVSHFDTLEELEAAISNPNPGEAYSVGTEHPYSLYAYDFLNKQWTNYGFIRAADIAARMAQNAVVSVSAWEEDLEVFKDYIFKAKIPLGEINGNDFAMVAFSPEDAVGGNFCPVCFAFDGYVEIWAKTIPTADIIIPAVTFIILDTEGGTTGGSTKGITNASGGIGTEQIADNALTTPKYANGSVTRAKLAQDALYSPLVKLKTDGLLTVEHLGKTLAVGWNVSAILSLSRENSTVFPVGAEIAVLRYGPSMDSTCQIKGTDGVKFAIVGETATKQNATVSISEPFGMIALKKLSTESAGDVWLVTGNVEVVE